MRIYTQKSVPVFVPSDWSWFPLYLSLSIRRFSMVLVGFVVFFFFLFVSFMFVRAFTTASTVTQEENAMVHIEQKMFHWNRRKHIVIPPRTFSGGKKHTTTTTTDSNDVKAIDVVRCDDEHFRKIIIFLLFLFSCALSYVSVSLHRSHLLFIYAFLLPLSTFMYRFV